MPSRLPYFSFLRPTSAKRGPLVGIGSWLAAHWRDGLSLLTLLVLGNIVMEMGYRLYQYWALPRALFEIVDRQKSSGPTSTDQFMFDANVGYRYTPNFDGQRGHPWFSHWRTNRHGHVSQFEYPTRKPPGEYRIAVVGDSMTANITNNVRWTEVLEERLNESPRWRTSLGERFTRVINFGLDGTGMVQFGALVRHHVMSFEPDLVVVNFISDSFLRRLRYNIVPYLGGDRDENIRKYVRQNYLSRIDWFSPYPELFAATVGNLWGMRSSIPIDAKVLRHLIRSSGSTREKKPLRPVQQRFATFCRSHRTLFSCRCL
jgi:GDSL-like Lipase/Acylhydrolase